MRNHLIPVLGLLALALPQVAMAAEESPRIISTQGESVVYVAPDKVIVNFGVQTTDRDLDKCRAANDEKSASLVKSLKAFGIDEKYIQADAMNLNIRYVSGQRMTIEGYEATRSYSITLKDVKKFEALVDDGLKNGANVFNGFSYQSTDLRKYRDQARQMAMKAAQEKAAALAGALNCTIGAPRSITESGGYYSRDFNSNSMTQNSAQVVPGGGDGADGEVMPLGQIGIRADVSITFDLVPPKP